MATLSLANIKPRQAISENATPKAIREALEHIFQNIDRDVWLVGGTAIAGYYAEHRRSDDIDLFALTPTSHQIAVLATKSLKKKGAQFSNERTTPAFYRATVDWQQHAFTVDVVLDEQLKQYGKAIPTRNNIYVADLQTLFASKIACLLSRASEKDFYDIDWILKQMKEFEIGDLVQEGTKVDGGLTIETLLISLQGTTLRKEACHFLLKDSRITSEEVYQTIKKLQKSLIEKLLDYEKKLPINPEEQAIAQNLKDQKKIK